MGKTTACAKRFGVALLMAGVATISILVSGCGSGSSAMAVDPKIVELKQAGFTGDPQTGQDIQLSENNPFGDLEYSAFMGSCHTTAEWLNDGTSATAPRHWEATINGIKVEGPTKPMLMADPRFAPCFPELTKAPAKPAA